MTRTLKVSMTVAAAALVAAWAHGDKTSSGLSVRPSEQMQSAIRGASKIVTWPWVMGETQISYSGNETLEVVLVASLICNGKSVCAETQSKTISLRQGETRSAASMFGKSRLFDEGTLTGLDCCESQASIGPEGISLRQAQAAFGESALRKHPAVLVVAAVPAEGGKTITNPLAMYLAMINPVDNP